MENTTATETNVPATDTNDQFSQDTQTTCMIALDSLGVIRIEGDNAAKLLHGQATNSIEKMQPGEIKPAALCSPKGRIYATFYALHQGDHFKLIIPRSTIEHTLTTLGKFAPLYRCQLSDVSEQYQVVGFTADTIKLDNPELTPTSIPEEARSLLLLSKEQATTTLEALSGQFTPENESYWNLLSIRLARVLIEQEQSDQFIPQMLNYQATGMISFKKGCYTGQEIIARAQYRGGVKKRIQHFILPEGTEGQPGSTVVSTEGDAGEVLLTSYNSQGNQECLAVVKDNALEQTLYLNEVDGPQLQLLPLPYDLEKRDI